MWVLFDALSYGTFICQLLASFSVGGERDLLKVLENLTATIFEF